jgi:hypothetical protein
MVDFEPDPETEPALPAAGAADAPIASSSPEVPDVPVASSSPEVPDVPVATSSPEVERSPVAAALTELDTLSERELAEHPEVYQRIHAELQAALSAIDDA